MRGQIIPEPGLTAEQVQMLVGEMLVPVYRKLADESRSSTTLADDDSLVTDVLPAGTYTVDALLVCQTSSSAFLKAAIVAETGALATAAVVVHNAEDSVAVALGSPFLPRDNSSGIQSPMHVNTVIALSTPGTIKIQWAAYVSTPTVRAGSYLRVIKIS